MIPDAQRTVLRDLLSRSLAPILEGDSSGPLSLDAALVASTWNDPSAIRTVSQALSSKRHPEGRRLQAIDALVGTGDASVLDFVGPAIVDGASGSPRFRGEMLGAMGRLDSPRVPEVVLKAYPRLDSDLKPRAVELLTQRTGWTLALLDAVDRKEVATSALNVNQIRKLSASNDRALADRVRSIWGIVREARNPAREKVITEMKAFLNDAHGDPVAGVKVFQNVCGQCHKMYGEGQEVGPEITLNGRASYEQLLSNVFDPSLVIGTAYQATTVATADGRVLTGLIVEDSPQRLVIKLQGGKLETIPKTAIEQSKLNALSMMPEGVESQVTPRELADLFAYITLDKPPGDTTASPLPGTPRGIRK